MLPIDRSIRYLGLFVWAICSSRCVVLRWGALPRVNAVVAIARTRHRRSICSCTLSSQSWDTVTRPFMVWSRERVSIEKRAMKERSRMVSIAGREDVGSSHGYSPTGCKWGEKRAADVLCCCHQIGTYHGSMVDMFALPLLTAACGRFAAVGGAMMNVVSLPEDINQRCVSCSLRNPSIANLSSPLSSCRASYGQFPVFRSSPTIDPDVGNRDNANKKKEKSRAIN